MYDPNNINHLLGAADFYLNQKKGASALRLYERVLELDPKNEIANERLQLPTLPTEK